MRRNTLLARAVHRFLRPSGRVASVVLVSLMAGSQLLSAEQPSAEKGVAGLLQTFRQPPDDARIMMRWWWFGPGVEKKELEREIVKMKSVGIGGFEIQPVYPLALDNPETGFKNLPYLSDEFLDAVRFANQKGKELGLRTDMTIASGWPFGGPHIPITQAAGQLRLVSIAVAEGKSSVSLPSIGSGETLLAAFLASGKGKAYDTATAKRLTLPAAGQQRLTLDAPAKADQEVLYFVSSRTGQQVKRPAVGADGFVLDHLDRTAIDSHLKIVADRLMTAFGDRPPYAVFSDSLEVFQSDWTPKLAEEFQKRRGYDVIPYLPSLYSGNGPDAKSVRADWGRTLSELVEENYLVPVTQWAKAHQTRFRSQTYGFPPVTLSSNNLVDLPEGEGPQWNQFSFTRWATSGSHLYGRNVTSAETWTWLHSPSFRATPLDMKQEADKFFLEGVNQIIGHGWPYSTPSAPEPGWALYAAAAFNDHNPWYVAFPDLTRYLQRVSWLLRQGEPANDVAIYVPTEDIWSLTSPGRASITENAAEFITPELTAGVLSSGYNFDYIDASAIEKLGIKYPVLILPNVDRISLATYQKLEKYVQSGGKIIATGRLPEHATGLKEQGDSVAINALSQSLFSAQGKGLFVKDVQELGSALKKSLTPDMQFSTAVPAVGFLHRKLADSDVYFIANTSNQPVLTEVVFRSKFKTAEEVNPFSGESAQLLGKQIALHLDPYGSTIVIFHDGAATTKKIAGEVAPGAVVADLSKDWQVRFLSTGKTETMSTLKSWTEEEATEYYSGEASYERDFALAKKPTGAVLLDFGEGKALPVENTKKPGTRAWFESPVREAAMVVINGQTAGYVWHPPFRLDVAPYLKQGKNHIELRVGNTAINGWSGRSLTDYRLLYSRFGQRFVPQDVENMEPLPSGILEKVVLVEGKAAGKK